MVTNDPASIRQLFERCDEKMIYKPLRPMVWRRNGHERAVFTSPLSREDLIDDDALRFCPGIYQENIPKAFEVRANIMGASVAAVAIDSQSNEKTAQDWRIQSYLDKPLPLRPINLPDEVFRACRALMRRLGTVFGAFDFIVTPNGEWIFLEVNGMGQFLWIEDQKRYEGGVDEVVPMCQMFAEFLESGDKDFVWSGKVDSKFSFQAYLDSPAFAAFEENPFGSHVRPPERALEQEDDEKDDEKDRKEKYVAI